MTWFDYILIAWCTIAVFTIITQIGKPRDPLTPNTAAFAVSIQVAIIVGVLASRGVLG